MAANAMKPPAASIPSPGLVMLAGAAGFEPAHAGTKNRCLTAWLRPNTSGRAGSKRRPYTQAASAGKGFFVPFPKKTSVGSHVHQIAIIFLQLQVQGTDFEIPGASRLHRGDFRGTPGQEELFEAFQFVRPDHAFFDFYTALAGQFDNGLACDAIEEAVWRRRVDFAVADEEGVCASRFSHLPAPVEHQRIVETAISRVMLRHGCDHVQPRCLCLSRRGIGRRPPPWRDIQADALGRVAKYAPHSQQATATCVLVRWAATPICSGPRQATGRT